ncbi:hypothetical protein [Pseudovibrio sp. Ad26]|uniref:hypothetical protein n=1 Tax=Pseudovibrio sp. Ad26 TaxID=989410 RepID=UPI0007B29EFD|nr:hypothetical protein [Pseudovibrio sp. Ad26]KZL06001.1 hypothetical protein PsAD26_04147 [Pseudovibrio sp. Ad26]
MTKENIALFTESDKLLMVQEARLIFGEEAAKALWFKLDLPRVAGMTSHPSAQSKGAK